MANKKYQIILADPPWAIRWQGNSSIGTKPLAYPTMTMVELVDFGEKVKSISEDCSKLFMWTTNGFLPEAIGLLKHWGFQYDKLWTWCKPTGAGGHPRNATEHLIEASRGALKSIGRHESPKNNWIQAPTKGHSTKPELMREVIEYCYPNYSKIELFARRKVEGWDDPRLYTLKGLKRRGVTPKAIRNFCEKIGVTKFVSETDPKLLDACVREELNDHSLRLMAVVDPIKVVIENYDPMAEEVFEIDLTHSEDAIHRNVPFSREVYIEREDFREEANKKYHRLKLNGEVRLKGAYVIKAVSCDKDKDGNVETVYCTFDPNSKSGMELDRKIKGTIHWVSCEHADEIEVREYENENILYSNGYAEPALTRNNLVKSYPVQFLRKGYYSRENNVFHKTVSLKEWKGA